MKHHSSFVIGLSLVLVLLLAACSPAATPVPATEAATEVSDPATEAPTEEPTATLEPTPEAITIVDGLGRTVTFETLPQRIAITGKAHFMIVDAVYFFPEAVERVAALSKSQQTATKAFVELLDPDYEAKAIFDSDSGPEQIAAAQPDLLLLKSSMAQGMGAAVEELDIPVIYVDLETPEQYQRDLAILGQVFGNPARAEEIWGLYQSQVDQMAATAAAEAEKPRVLLMQYAESSGEVALKVPPASWMQTQMVEMAGGQAIWKETTEGGGWAVVNLEQIAAWDPDQIFIVNYFGNVDETVAALMADPKWEGLKAVQNEQVYGFPKDYYSWDQPDSRWYLGLTWLATKIQPEGFQADMGEVFSNFYETFYGMDAAAVEESLVPLLEGKSW